jgi:succinoglycan biosynthesis protein ExoA
MVTASVVMTVKGEPAGRLRRVIGALAGQEGLAGGLELLVAADPTDPTATIDTEPGGAIRSVTVVPNPGGQRSAGLNRAVQAAASDRICRIDARTLPGPGYVAGCVALLDRHPEAGVVGGVQRPTATAGTLQAQGIARALSNPWALGGAAYRTGRRAGPVDTVYLGAFRRGELLGVGGYDEGLEANEDFELCQRYRAAGAVVWLDPGLDVAYEARDTLAGLWGQYLAFGRSKVRFWRTTGSRPNRRQWLAVGIAAGAGGGVLGTALRRPRSVVPLCGALTAGLAVLDCAVPGDADRLPVRVAALPAYGTLFTAWIAGIAAELAAVTARPSPARSAGSDR